MVHEVEMANDGIEGLVEGEFGSIAFEEAGIAEATELGSGERRLGIAEEEELKRRRRRAGEKMKRAKMVGGVYPGRAGSYAAVPYVCRDWMERSACENACRILMPDGWKQDWRERPFLGMRLRQMMDAWQRNTDLMLRVLYPLGYLATVMFKRTKRTA
jgi:hypothetical protein